MKALFTVAASLFLVSCAAGKPAGSPADTDLYVVDDSGSSVPGDYEMWSPKNKDACSTSGSGCSVSLPEGDYYMTFAKMRGGRVNASGANNGGGNIGGEKRAGCLRARVHLVPGVEIHCKKIAEYNCARQATETMDCGAAQSSRYGPAQKAPQPPAELPPEAN